MEHRTQTPRSLQSWGVEVTGNIGVSYDNSHHVNGDGGWEGGTNGLEAIRSGGLLAHWFVALPIDEAHD